RRDPEDGQTIISFARAAQSATESDIRLKYFRNFVRLRPLCAVNQTVESHQPLPAHQQLSSGFELRRKVRTLLESPRLNAADNFCAASSSRAPRQGTNIAVQTNRASKWSVAVRVTRSMPPAPGIPPGPSAGVRGNSKRPFNCRASSQTFNGAVAPAFT